MVHVVHRIEAPSPDDAAAVGRMQLRAWLQTYVTLGPMYLLNEVQGHGIGGQLMGEFFLWADGAPLHLWVTEYNGRAIRFYERHGFQLTGERALWRDRLPNVRMARGPMQHPRIA
ncbi:GNAT family N-acetyltransferase [Streptomyces sp. NPDC006512]|uniref:GNAT family N-acetyltransferase n=1 Tax=Streptomyces sp. NPDC006512 TaxID=3154307 RepID=UPI0033BC5FC7